jgi:hypothetical protein
MPGLLNLVASLLEQDVDIIVYNNGYTEPLLDIPMDVEIVDATGWSFYSMWNDAWRTSCDMGYGAVALLNDDIVLHHKSLRIAYKELLSNNRRGIVGLNYERPVSSGPDETLGSRQCSGSFRNHGIGGHAFILRASTLGRVPEIDERYNIWYGDDELFRNVEEAGYSLHVALGAPVDHYSSTTTNQFPELLGKTGLDRDLFLSKFGEV